MNYISHTIGGVAAGIGIMYLSAQIGIEPTVLPLISGSVIGALLPDVDHPKSYLGKRVSFLSTTLYSTVGHRTLTHSLIFSVFIGLLCSLFNVSFGIGIALGIISHIFLDMLSPMGVAYLYPWKKHRIKWVK